MADEESIIIFSSDNEENSRLNKYVNELIQEENGVVDVSAKQFLKIFIEDSMKKVRDSSTTTIYKIIELAIINYQKNSILKEKKKKKVVGYTKARDLKYLTTMEDSLLKQLGLDAKSIATSMGKGNTLSENILSIIKNSEFFNEDNKIGTIDAAKALMSPLLNSKNIPDKDHVDIYENMKPEQLIDFLKTAKAT